MYRIAVIDDEPKIRRGISDMLRNIFSKKAVITDFASVHEILEYSGQERIDILITDICMPDMDGLLLAKKLKSFYLDLKIIVISGYSEFEYAKEAISLQVCEYLLKPIEPEQLIKTVILAMERLEKERTGWGIDLGKREHERYLLRAIRQKDVKTVKRELEWLKLKPPYCIVMMEKQENKPEPDQESSPIACLEKEADICEAIGKGQQVYLIAGVMETALFCGLTERNTKRYDWNFNLGLCGCDSPEDLHQAYRQALGAAKQALYTKGECGHIYRYRENGSWIFDAGKEAMLILNRLCCKEEFTDILKEMHKDLMVEKPDYDSVERGMQDFLSQLQSVFEKDDAMGAICKALTEMKEQFSFYDSFERFFDDLRQLLEEAGSLISNVRNMRSEQNMKKAIAFIEKNYCYDLSLEEVAQQAHFNPSYFSSYFKKYTGMSLINYMMELRLKKAKELLKNPDIRIMEITKELGFHDTRYFAKIFKRSTGVTPSDYRSIMLQIRKEDT